MKKLMLVLVLCCMSLFGNAESHSYTAHHYTSQDKINGLYGPWHPWLKCNVHIYIPDAKEQPPLIKFYCQEPVQLRINEAQFMDQNTLCIYCEDVKTKELVVVIMEKYMDSNNKVGQRIYMDRPDIKICYEISI